MFSEVDVSPWDGSVPRPTVDPIPMSIRDDTHLNFWDVLAHLMPL